MKKIVLGVVILLIAAPVWADTVNIDVNDEGGGTISIEYSVSDANLVRAFALNITVDNGAVIESISDYVTGECNAVAKGYGIFPGGIVIDSNGDPSDYNTPVAPPDAPDSPGQLGSGSIVIEMGSLYTGANSPGTSGRLAKLKITGIDDCNLCISSVNTLRGGIVMEDTSITGTPNLPGCTPLVLDCLYVDRVFNSGLVVTQAMYDKWATMGTDCVNKDPWWCCEAQKYGQATGVSTRVDVADLSKVKLAWMKRPCLAGYFSAADFNLSGRIDVADLAKVKLNWMQRPGICP